MPVISSDQQAILAHHRPLWKKLKGGHGSRPLEELVPGFHASVQALFDQGYCLTDIGLMFGLSRERIRQIAAKGGLRVWPTTSPAREWSWDQGRFVPSVATKTLLAEQRRSERWAQHRQRILSEMQEHFWSQIEMAENGCWLWLGDMVGPGYGIFYRRPPGWGKTTTYAHRIAYLFSYGVLNRRLQVCHHCDHPLCVNPEHLFQGTAADNIHDSIAKGRHIASPQRRAEFLEILRLNGLRRRKLA